MASIITQEWKCGCIELVFYKFDKESASYINNSSVNSSVKLTRGPSMKLTRNSSGKFIRDALLNFIREAHQVNPPEITMSII